jgi:hypothetical protein
MSLLNIVNTLANQETARHLRQMRKAANNPSSAWRQGREAGWVEGWRLGQADLIMKLKAGELSVEDL